MKILLVGASGTIGKHLFDHFSKDHEVINVSRNAGDINADITDPESIKKMYESAGPVDAVISATGGAYFGPFSKLNYTHGMDSFGNKAMGQINLVLEGQHHLKKGGSFTLISGILSEDPIKHGAALSMVNGAINAFVPAAAMELFEKGLRVNVISPGLVEDSVEALGSAFPGHNAVKIEDVIKAYEKSILGFCTGQIIKVY
ncbi:short chain dehydrogenase [Marinigracilibium pacificum]|uniref:Short chain dehydrogenase n=1 Tax=Marinigracilibium pacificum TaxID=2729599 RepID=A0A848J7L3_9BACT|nr:short chain dehydrogenase [Marinigracilibium pacificum]NMM50414.1 short chain dehydrogenase [Marinigracilibium pacificum]